MQNNFLKIGVFIMSVGMPAARLQIDFHIAANRLLVANLEDRSAEIRTTLTAGKTGMKNPDRPALGGLELIPFQTLVQPDGLQQFFRRRRLAVAQLINGA